MRIRLKIAILLLWSIETNVFQMPQLHKHFSVVRNRNFWVLNSSQMGFVGQWTLFAWLHALAYFTFSLTSCFAWSSRLVWTYALLDLCFVWPHALPDFMFCLTPCFAWLRVALTSRFGWPYVLLDLMFAWSSRLVWHHALLDFMFWLTLRFALLQGLLDFMFCWTLRFAGPHALPHFMFCLTSRFAWPEAKAAHNSVFIKLWLDVKHSTINYYFAFVVNWT